MCSEAGRGGGEEDFDDETPTKDHVVLRVQVERLSFPAELSFDRAISSPLLPISKLRSLLF
jgi:hypothetical protein